MPALKTTALALLIPAGVTASAHATDILLPSATFFGGASGNQFNKSFNGPDQGVSDSNLFDSVSASAAALGGFKVEIAGSTSAMWGGTIAEAHERYYFALLSAFPTDVHVLINAAADASGAGLWFAEAEVGINAKDGSFNQALAYELSCSSSSGCPTFTPDNGGQLAVTLTANKIYSIHLDVNGHTSGPDSAFSAFADPVISFDPAYDLPTGITFQFSPNLTDAMTAALYAAPPKVGLDDGGGVPEPGTWAMMLIGFGAMGGLLRRRRTGLAAQPAV